MGVSKGVVVIEKLDCRIKTEINLNGAVGLAAERENLWLVQFDLYLRLFG